MSPISNPGVGTTVELGELNLTADSLLHSDSAAAAEAIADVAANQVLTSQGTTTVPAWGFVEFYKSITIEDPTASEDLSMFFTNKALTILEMRAVLVGSATPSVTMTIRHGTDRNAAGAEAVTGGTVVTSTTTGSDITVFNDATIVADSFVWLETTAQSGTVTELHVTIIYRET